MSKSSRKLQDQYACALRHYLDSGGEDALHMAYELGREAITGGFGVLDMVKIHHQAAISSDLPVITSGNDKRRTEAIETFFMEALSPFEAHHRGFREANDRLRNLSSKILHAQEEERKRISRELHDEVGQALTAINMTLATLKNNGVGSSEAGRRKLTDAQQLLEGTMETVHDFARELRPAMLDELGLLPALRSHLKGFAGRTGMRIHFHGNPIAEKLENNQKTVVFRIAQECLTNVSKHARASQVVVAIRKFKDGMCMEVTDNGRSFKADAVNAAR